ncbi:MAG: hypothetical protein IKP65_04115 [Alphaproteobacteria bacterium]|nr:hypothetical protein [Alphaproteobacteria bacterium]
MLKYLYYLIKNPMVDFTGWNELPQAVYRPRYLSKYRFIKKTTLDCLNMGLPLTVVNFALMYGIGYDKPYLDKECDGTVQLYQLDPIVFKKEEIEIYSKYLPIEVSFKYLNHKFYLTCVKQIRRM